jgi:hypothetical protein
MELNHVNEIYEEFIASKHQTLVKSLINYAVKYSNLRVEWLLSDIETRTEIDVVRTRTHNALISAYNALVRNMRESGEDAHWRTLIGEDRKSIGDFAVLLVAVMGIRAR